MAGAIICGMIALGAFIFGITQLCEKGAPFNNAYIFASEKERMSMNKKPYYRQSGIVLILLGAIFALDSAEFLLHTGKMLYAVIALAVIALIYAVVSTVLTERKK